MFANLISKKIVSGGLAVVVALGLIGGSYYLGYERGIKNPEELIVKGVTNIGDEDVKADFSIFWEAWKKLKDHHVEGKNTEDEKFVSGAISGLAGTFKDPNTIYLPPPEAKQFQDDIKGEFGGIGAEIGLKNEQLTVIAPLKKSPAEKAGLKSGDKILQIDDFKTDGISVNDAVKRIRGPIGTAVVLSILRDGWSAPQETRISRGKIVVPTIKWDFIGNIAHVQLYSFNEQAPTEFYKAGSDILLKQSQGIILDLRGNPGGFLEVAINIAGWFLERGYVVAKERFKDPTDDRIFRANGNQAFEKKPVVILLNRGSASASEILAGALRDHREIKIIGEQSFGKGTVQELHDLRDGSQLKITVARWLTPKDQVIDGEGLKPDFEVKITEEDLKAERDPQLKKAIEVLKEMLQ